MASTSGNSAEMTGNAGKESWSEETEKINEYGDKENTVVFCIKLQDPTSLPGSYPADPLQSPCCKKLEIFLNRYNGYTPGFIKRYLQLLLSSAAELEDYINTNVILNGVSTRTRISPAVSLFLFCLGCVLGLKTHPLFVSKVLGISFPIYRSLLAIERPRLNDDERWLTYCMNILLHSYYFLL